METIIDIDIIFYFIHIYLTYLENRILIDQNYQAKNISLQTKTNYPEYNRLIKILKFQGL